MSSPGHDENSDEEEKNPIFFFDFLENIVVSKIKAYFKCYLISTNSIPKLMEIIEKSKILDNISNNEYNKSINDLKSLLDDYDFEKSIDFIDSCDKCSFIKDEKNNEFILASEAFMNYIGYKNSIKENCYSKKVEVKEYWYILFLKPKFKLVFFNEKNVGFINLLQVKKD